MGEMRERVLAASAGRDRVVDAVKALALCLVVVGHSLAWTVLPDGTVTNTLDAAPGAFWVTWVLQILPLFLVVAGTGLVRCGAHPTAVDVLRRVDRLVSPALPLLAVTLVAAWLLGLLASDDIAAAAGVLPVQLVWFLGVYLLVVAVGPVIVRMRRPWHFLVLGAAIAAVDALRVNGFAAAGWLNLLLVWGLFAALGVNLGRLRAARPKTLAAVLVVAVAVAVTLIVVGPYSPALITTDALPGLSNLAPPSAVLACFGVAQLMALLLVWRVLERWLARDDVWVPVAVFGSRAMGVYLWHMLLLSVVVAALLAVGPRPETLSAAWWAEHLAVLLVVGSAVFFAAPLLLHLGDATASALGRLLPDDARRAVGRLPAWAALALAAAAGVALLLVSESGVADPLTARAVVGVPYVPILALFLLAGAVAVARGATRGAPHDRAPVGVG